MVFLVRHGQTAGNRAKVLQGRGSNQPLNDKGVLQAQAVRRWFEGQHLRIDRVYASPLLRAAQTARIIVPGVEPLTDERLLEMDYGPYEGMDLGNPPPQIRAFFADFVNTPAPEGMEPLQSVTRRLGSFLEMIRPEAVTGNILIATHAIAMKGALEYLTEGANGMYWDRYIGNCAVYRVEAGREGYASPEEVIMKQEERI